MAFNNDDFMQAGASNNNASGGQLYVAWSATDNRAAMIAANYFDGIEDRLNTGDVMIVTGTDGINIGRLVNTAGVMTFVALPIV